MVEIKLLDKEVTKELRSNFITRLTTLIMGAFGIIAGLAWNEAVKAWLNTFIKPGEGALPLTIYAVVVTVILVFVTMLLGWIGQRLNN